MVGVIILGIVSGIISATVFAVIPWAQDHAAQGDLQTVDTAESVSLVKNGTYETVDQLTTGGLLPGDGGSVEDAEETTSYPQANQPLVALGTNCYVAAIRSTTGNVYYLTSSNEAVQNAPVTSPAPDTNSCAPFPSVAAFASGVSGGSDGSYTLPGGTQVCDQLTAEPDYTNYTVSTVVGSGNFGTSNGAALDADLQDPSDVVTDQAGDIYIDDFGNGSTGNETAELREVSGGVVTQIAVPDFSQYVGGALGIDSAGNIYLISTTQVFKMAPGGTPTLLAGSGTVGYQDGTGANAEFSDITAITVAGDGTVYVADTQDSDDNGGGSIFREISPAGVVTTLAGNGQSTAQNGQGTAASAPSVDALAVDQCGDVFYADYPDNLIQEITPSGLITTFAGNGSSTDQDGSAADSAFENPFWITIDPAGNLYVTDADVAIRKITAAGQVTTIAGNPDVYGNVDGPGSTALFENFWDGLYADASGDIFVADTYSHRIREITPVS